MVIHLPPSLETVLEAVAAQRGISPEELAVEGLRTWLFSTAAPVVPQDDWERAVLGAGVACGLSVPDAALSSDGLYE